MRRVFYVGTLDALLQPNAGIKLSDAFKMSSPELKANYVEILDTEAHHMDQSYLCCL